VQEKLITLQQLLEVANITKENMKEGGRSIIMVEEVETTHQILTKLATGHKMLQIETDAIEFQNDRITKIGEGNQIYKDFGVTTVDTHIKNFANGHVA
jgi:hypothetical protein